MMEKYDSTEDTLEHKNIVLRYVEKIISYFMGKGIVHDNSKLMSPEKEIFDIYTPKLKTCEYNSVEYKQNLQKMKLALDNHYSHNSHHPEHYEEGIDGMDLVDLLEMLCDWKASTKRMKSGTGDIYKSLAINKDRYKISEQLYNILKNTIDRHLND